MAVGKFKLAFLALALACLVQDVAPRALAGGDKFSPPRELEIVGRAVAEIFKSFTELVQSMGAVVVHALAEGVVKVGLPVYLKVHVIFTASGMQDASMHFSPEQHREYRVVAKTVLRLRQKLEAMERFEETYNSILDEVAVSALVIRPKEMSPPQVLTSLVQSFVEAADRRLRFHTELKQTYLRIRSTVESEDAETTPTILDFGKMSGDPKRLAEILPESVRTNLLVPLLNKQFLHHTVNRISILKKEYFVAARSTLELAKKPNKADAVQQVYDKTLRQVSSYLDALKADAFDLSKGLFKELKSNFEENPSLNQEWREMQKYVSQRHEWDRSSIWDLDLFPF